MTRSQITVDPRPVADRYGNEKIIEFSSPVGGGLISFTITPDDQLSVHVYRQDMTVSVTAGEAGQPVRHGDLRADQALYQAAKAFVTDWESRNPDTCRPGHRAAGCTNIHAIDNYNQTWCGGQPL